MATSRFFESPAPGLQQAYEATPLHSEDSAFQHIDVYEHPSFGRMLVLDGAVQTTTKDEFIYHEMLVHVPLLAHPEPRRVLVIGGGDGGSLRRVLEHPTVSEAVMVEIDERVTAVCREYLSEIGRDCWDDPRATVLFEDGNAYVDAGGGPFDAIIVDSSDPVGPGAVLFQTPFYARCRERLAPGGVFGAQSGSPYFMQEDFRRAFVNAAAAFPDTRVYLATVPTYPGVVWSFLLAGQRLGVDAATAEARAADRKLSCRFWTPEVHAAAFALPGLVREALRHPSPPEPFGP